MKENNMTEQEFINQVRAKGQSNWAINKAVEIDRKRGAFDKPKQKLLKIH